MAKARGIWAQSYTAQLLAMISQAVSGKGKVDDFMPKETKPKRRVSSREEIDRYLSRFPESKANG